MMFRACDVLPLVSPAEVWVGFLALATFTSRCLSLTSVEAAVGGSFPARIFATGSESGFSLHLLRTTESVVSGPPSEGGMVFFLVVEPFRSCCDGIRGRLLLSPFLISDSAAEDNSEQ